MKFGFSTLACPRWTLPEIVGFAAAHGFHGIDARGLGDEIDITRLPAFNDELPATRDLLRRHNLEIACLNTSIALVTPAPERWEMMLDECHRHARLAELLDTRLLRVFGGAVPRGMSRGQAIVLARRHLHQLCHIAAPRQCRILLETHDEWATSDQIVEIMSEFSPSEAGVLWNVEQPCRHGEAPDRTADGLRRLIQHVHLKDSSLIEGKSIPRLIGDGDLPLRDVLRALNRIDYNAWICLETEKRWLPETAPDPEQSLPRFIQWMRSNQPA